MGFGRLIGGIKGRMNIKFHTVADPIGQPLERFPISPH